MPRDVLVNALSDRDGVVRLLGRTGWYEVEGSDAFYIRTSEIEKFPGTWREHISEPVNGFARVVWPEPARGGRLNRLDYYRENLFTPREIEVLEADVDPAQRFIIEHPNVQFANDWRWFFYDLETEKIRDWGRPWEQRILSFSWKSKTTGAKGHVRLAEKTDAAERRLLEVFLDLASRHDILIGWNASKFDARMIKGRCHELDVAFESDLYHWIDHLWLFKRYFLRSEDGAVKQSFKLDAIAAGLLGEERKVPLEERARAAGWTDQKGEIFSWVWKNAPALMREYNDQDVHLMDLIEEKTGFIKLHISLARLCRVLPAERSLYPSTLVDGRMLQRGQAEGYRFPTRFREESVPHRARGAFVPEAMHGVFDSVAVLDYARMYPSIILTWNMSLDTIARDGDLRVPETSPRGKLLDGYVARFRSAPEGHLPAALRGVIEERKRYSKLKDEAEIGSEAWHDAGRLSQACKVLANTFYGVILSPFSRFYRAEIGESVTSIGRYLLTTTLAEVERRGHRFVFGDTDSVAFVATDEEAVAVRDAMNQEVLPRALEPFGAKPGVVQIDYEKRFRRVVVTASKRYAGVFAVYGGKVAKPDAAMDVRGLEIVRTDVCRAARTLQKSVLEWVLDSTEPDVIWRELHQIRADFVAGKTPTPDLVITKSLTKQLDEYKTMPLQGKVAQRMIERGVEIEEGARIPYLLSRRGPIIPDEKDELDLELYWNKHIFPPTLRVLEACFPDLLWNDHRFHRGYDPKQASFFADPLAPRRKGTSSEFRPVRPVRPVIAPIEVRIAERADIDVVAEAERIKRTFEAFPGDRPIVLHFYGLVESDGKRRVYEIECPQRVADPAVDLRFAGVLRTIGVDLGR